MLDLPLVTIRSAGYFEHLFRFPSTGRSLIPSSALMLPIIHFIILMPICRRPAVITGRNRLRQATILLSMLFLIIKLKRTRFFLMFDHLNYGMMSGEKLL